MTDNMPASFAREWAKEFILQEIDHALETHKDNYTWDADTHAALIKQRNRIAKLFNLPVKTDMFYLDNRKE